VSNLEDSRVLSAFSAQQSALPYMIGVEQRLGVLKSQISDSSTLASQVATNTVNISTNTANISTNAADILSIETNYIKRNIVIDGATGSAASVTTPSSTFVDTGFSATITNTSGKILALATFDAAYIGTSGGIEIGNLAWRVDSGSDLIVYEVYVNSQNYNNYGFTIATLLNVSAGTRVIKLRFKTTGGLFYVGSGVAGSYVNIIAMEI